MTERTEGIIRRVGRGSRSEVRLSAERSEGVIRFGPPVRGADRRVGRGSRSEVRP
jgi:hypothetical protein